MMHLVNKFECSECLLGDFEGVSIKSLLLVHSAYFLHLLLREFEIEDVEVIELMGGVG